MKLLLTMLLAVALLAVPAFSFSWTYYDFGDNVFDEHNNTHDMSFGYPNSYPDQPSPGGANEGGEVYDIEGLNFAYDNTYIYLSLTNSFGYEAYSSHFNDTYALGDLFFGFDGANTTYAVVLGEAEKNGMFLAEISDFDLITDKPGTYYNNVAIRTEMDAFRATDGTTLGAVESMLTDLGDVEPDYLLPGDGQTYVFEMKFLISDLGVDLKDFSTINFHNNVECGNDLLEKEYNIVPEPTTMILLGLGLVGVGARLRRKK